MPTIWRCSWCENECRVDEAAGWWEWRASQVEGPELVYHICSMCFGEKFITKIVNIGGIAEVKNLPDESSSPDAS